ncbi:hypothetical protein [Pedobacter sp. Hv1]|uniref:hypothetical protein n=1 Tax=Pedobacter sp. Hv1 TaxID=1740090 RepID=UPI0006D8A929|nr:hypothetical protein [Pedobacter sp. Hv1]KQC01744.1 hypothetical protein AQF98_05065 [Pedobacter sp. Hv1]
MKSQITVPTIPLPDAVARVTRFRAQLAGSVPEANIPRAILIPIADILAIVNKYQTITPKGDITVALKGVRAYFAVKREDEDLPDDITALIVPVNLQGDDIITTPPGLGDGDDDGSEIYDFTTPCPTECDVKSPLFVGQPG